MITVVVVAATPAIVTVVFIYCLERWIIRLVSEGQNRRGTLSHLCCSTRKEIKNLWSVKPSLGLLNLRELLIRSQDLTNQGVT